MTPPIQKNLADGGNRTLADNQQQRRGLDHLIQPEEGHELHARRQATHARGILAVTLCPLFGKSRCPRHGGRLLAAISASGSASLMACQTAEKSGLPSGVRGAGPDGTSCTPRMSLKKARPSPKVFSAPVSSSRMSRRNFCSAWITTPGFRYVAKEGITTNSS